MHPKIQDDEKRLLDSFRPAIDEAARNGPLPTAIVCPTDFTSLEGSVKAAELGLIDPILIGHEDTIKKCACENHIDISAFEIMDCQSPEEGAALGVSLVQSGRARSIMKGNLHSDDLLHEVIKSASRLRTDRRLSHVFVMMIPEFGRMLLITDAAINIAPNLEEKRDITQNAINLAHSLGIGNPRVAILSAVETVTSRIPSTLDAAALCKMADRGQITGGVLDGPLAMDNAINISAAEIKGINSPVAGNADILVVPNLESGNMLAKELTFISKAPAAGLVLGARVPIILTSRADTLFTRIASCVLAIFYGQFLKTGVPLMKSFNQSAFL